MRRDERLLNGAEERSQPMTCLRFFRWQVPTISLGKNQSPGEAVAVDYCARAGIPIVHRPTGGRAVFHAGELTYSVVSSDPSYFPLRKVRETYRVISQALKEGLQSLGIEVEVEGYRHRPSVPACSLTNPCFVTASRDELLCRGRKMVGSAQRQLRRSMLQHGSIPLRIDYLQMAAALGVDLHLLKRNVISVSEAKDSDLSFETVAAALRHGFEKVFQVSFQPFREGQGSGKSTPRNCVSLEGCAIGFPV